MRIFLFFLVFFLQLVPKTGKSTSCIDRKAQSISITIEDLNPAYESYAKNLLKTNRTQFFKTLQKRLNREKSSKERQAELLNSSFNSFFSSCEGSFVDCLKEISKLLPDQLSMASSLISYIDELSGDCKILGLVARRILLKNVSLKYNNIAMIEDFFRAGYYTKISPLPLEKVIEDPNALRFYSLSLAQIGNVQKIEEIGKNLENSTFDKGLGVELEFRKAVALKKKGKYVESINSVNRILNHEASAKFADWLYLDMAATYLNLKRPDLAELSLQSSITINNSNELLRAYQAILASNTNISSSISPSELQNFDIFDIFSFCSKFLSPNEGKNIREVRNLCEYIVRL